MTQKQSMTRARDIVTSDGRKPVPANVLSADDFRLWHSYERDVAHGGGQPTTLAKYGETIVQFSAFTGYKPLAGASKEDIREYLMELRQLGRSDWTVNTRYRALRAFYNWLAAEGIIAVSPMATLKVPQVGKRIIPMPTDDELAKLLRTCDRSTLDGARDEFIIRLLAEAGSPRATELCSVQLAEVDLRRDVIAIMHGKWSNQRVIRMGHGTAKALERYLYHRARHHAAGLPVLLVGKRGAMTRSGMLQMMKRRCLAAGIDNYSPHKHRHASAAAARMAGLDTESACELYGWKTASMYTSYGSAASQAIALAAAERANLGGRLR